MAGTVSTVVAVLSALGAGVGLLYPFGLLLLARQIMRTYGDASWTALYEASLLPVVAVILRLAALVLVSVFEFPVIAAAVFVESVVLSAVLDRADRTYDRNKQSRAPLLVGAAMIASGASILVVLNVAAMFRHSVEYSLAEVVFCLFTVIGIALLSIARSSKISKLRLNLLAFTMLYIACLASAYTSVGMQRLALPAVSVRTAAATTAGDLLAHTEGYWYIFTRPDGRLVGVPDRLVTLVTVLATKPSATPAAHTPRNRAQPAPARRHSGAPNAAATVRLP